MRVPLAWLREMVDWPDDVDTLAEALTRRGLAVEAVERPGARAAAIVAATIEAVEPMQGSDHLVICRLDAGPRGRGSVVSGAPNLAVGMCVPWAGPGAVLPGGRRLEAQDFHGVLSEGMACSADEIGLPGRHEDGLLAVDAAPGADLVALLELDDPVLVLELTPNYAVHCQSILGVAREVAALTEGHLRAAHQPLLPAGLGATYVASIKTSAPDLCGQFFALQLSGLSPRPAPLLVQRRLAAAGVRPRGAIVDATNHVMLELGQPLHAYDLRDLRGGLIQARRAAPGEELVTLDGQRRRLTGDDLVIADGERAVGVAGVMGGENTEVREDTTEVLLEAAYFVPATVARTARRLGLASAASARFARGVDPAAVRPAALRCAALMAAWAGGGLSAEPADVVTPALPSGERAVRLHAAHARALLGVKVTAAECGGYLAAMGFSVRADGADRLRVSVPSWRGDVAEEVDLVEEVGRAYGFDRIPEVLPGGAPGRPLRDPAGEAGEVVGAIARGAGYSEALTPPLQGAGEWERLRAAEGALRGNVAVRNPMTEDQSLLRMSLVPGLLAALGHNARHRRTDAALYEVGAVFLPAAPGAPPARTPPPAQETSGLPLVERTASSEDGDSGERLDGADTSPDGVHSGVASRPGDRAMATGAAAAAGSGTSTAASAATREIADGGAQAPPDERLHFALAAMGTGAGFLVSKGVVEVALKRLGISGLQWQRASSSALPYLHPGRSAVVTAGQGIALGYVGEVHPETAAAYGLAQPAAVAEIDLVAAARLRPERVTYRPWPKAPAVRRDLALVLPETVPAADVVAVMRRAGAPLLADCRLFDTYAGEGIASGARSLAYTLVYQAERTLTDAEVDRCHQAVREALQEELGAQLRS